MAVESSIDTRVGDAGANVASRRRDPGRDPRNVRTKRTSLTAVAVAASSVCVTSRTCTALLSPRRTRLDPVMLTVE